MINSFFTSNIVPFNKSVISFLCSIMHHIGTSKHIAVYVIIDCIIYVLEVFTGKAAVKCLSAHLVYIILLFQFTPTM